MRDGHNRHAGAMHRRQEFEVELAPELRILVGRPFVQQQERALFELRDDQRQPLALAAGQIDGAEFAVGEPRLFVQLELREQFVSSSGSGSGMP